MSTSWKKWLKRKPRRWKKSQYHRRHLLEPLEQRRLLAGDSFGAIGGISYIDATNDEEFNSGDTPIVGAEITLYRDGGDGVFDFGTIGSDDAAQATKQTDETGRYRFENLQAGRYFVEQRSQTGLFPTIDTAHTVDITAADALGAFGRSIDTFDDATHLATAMVMGTGTDDDDSSVLATEAIGGERDLFVELSMPGSITLSANQFSPVLQFDNTVGIVGKRVVSWDGIDSNAVVFNPSGLNEDLTAGGVADSFRLLVGADQANGQMTLRIYSGDDVSESTVEIPVAAGGVATEVLAVPFSSFTTIAGSGADFAAVGGIELEIEDVAAVNGQIDALGTFGPTVVDASFANVRPLSIGDLVWLDANNNGLFDPGAESGIDNVLVNLFVDTDGNEVFTPGVDMPVGTTATSGGGRFLFDTLSPGDYVIQVDPSNFSVGAPLAGLISSTGNQPTPDPDTDDTDGDDSGDLMVNHGVVSRAVTLNSGTEPIDDGDTDSDSNLAVDFGFAVTTDLAITKSDSPDPVIAGQLVTYTFSVTNHGPSAATGVTVTDVLPTELSYQSGSSTAGTVVHDGGLVTVEIGDLAAGVTETITIEALVDSSAVGTITNTAAVMGAETETNSANNMASADTMITSVIDLEITKSDDPDPVVAGQSLMYELTVTNHGPSDATSVMVTDTLPAGVAYQSAASTVGGISESNGTVIGNIGRLASGASAAITIEVLVDSAASGTITNTANVVGSEAELTTSNNATSEPTTIHGLIDLVITKSDEPEGVIAGNVLAYTLVVSNDGPSDASGVTVTDVLPVGLTYRDSSASVGSVSHSGGTVTANIGDLARGATATITIEADVDPALRGTITNTATVIGDQAESNTANNAASEMTNVEARTDLAIVKTDSMDTVIAGETLTYTLVVTNAGPSTATEVAVTDTLPGGVTYLASSSTLGSTAFDNGTVTTNIGDLPAAEMVTITIEVEVDEDLRGSLTNTANVGGNEPETLASNNSDSEDTVVAAEIDLTIVKTDSPDAVIAGGELTYELLVTNHGPSTATGVTVVDTLPGGVRYVSSSGAGVSAHDAGVITTNLADLAVGESVTTTHVVSVEPSTRGTINNIASVSGNEHEVSSANNTDDEVTTVDAVVDLAVVKSDFVDPVAVGEPLSYEIVVTNNGPSDATGVVLTDELPTEVSYLSANADRGAVSHESGSVTVQIGDLNVGESVTVAVVVQVEDTTAETISNHASVVGIEADAELANNSVVETTTINHLPSSIAGIVYLDNNNNGLLDIDEPRLRGVTIDLTGTDRAGNAVTKQVATNANGEFVFADLAAGQYTIAETQLASYRDGRDTLGSLPANDSVDDVFSDIELDPGVAATDYLFGERPAFFSKRRFLSSS